jgi:hypothetical protein
MKPYIQIAKTTLPLLALLCVPSLKLCAGTLSASATFTYTVVSPGVYQYDLTLNNTGTTDIGTFWFAWVPGEGFLTSTPTDILSPTGWSDMTTNSGAAIQWIDSGSLAEGTSVSGFEFDSTLTPSELAGEATSFVYIGAPFGDPGFELTATPAQGTVPEPATFMLSALGIACAGFGRRWLRR